MRPALRDSTETLNHCRPIVQFGQGLLPKTATKGEELQHGVTLAQVQKIFSKAHVGAKAVQLRRTRRLRAVEVLTSTGRGGFAPVSSTSPAGTAQEPCVGSQCRT